MINLVQKIPDKGHALIPHSWDQCMEKILEIIEAQVWFLFHIEEILWGQTLKPKTIQIK